MALRKRRPGLVYPTWEDWHYVGDTDEPAFGDDWENTGTPYPALAFRLVEAGKVEMIGSIHKVDTTGDPVFTFPTGYWPNEYALFPVYIHDVGTPEFMIGLAVITDAGEVVFAGPGIPVDDGYVYLSGSFNLLTAAP